MSLVATGLACQRGGRTLFSDISFDLHPGDALIVTGPNGSGKSSFLRILAGLLLPTAGTLRGFEKDVSENDPAYRQNIHYIGHENGLKLSLSTFDNLCLWRSLDQAIAQKALDRFGLFQAIHTSARLLSAGQRRRVALARLLTEHRPMWILDEPTASLDTASVEILCKVLSQYRTQGGIVVVATHTPLTIGPAQTLSLAKVEAA